MKTIALTVDGVRVTVVEGASAAAAVAARTHVFHHSRTGHPRGPFCGMGQCFECRIRINGRLALACLERASSGMAITTGA